MFDFNKLTEHSELTSFIEEILTLLNSRNKLKQGCAGQRLDLKYADKKMCLLLYSGACIVKRTQDSLVLSTIQSPHIFGLQDIFNIKSDMHLLAISDIEYEIMSVDDFLSHADKHDLWKKISYILMLSATRFCEYQKETVGISNYQLICNLLISLSTECFEIRATTTALEYIQERSMLSRSGIMKILSSLKEGGYVTMKKGVLIKINSLPKRF
ncbi:helix-turn-helix domain-containing protein [Serratia sp. N21D137]|uniref:helix-turn-helix domain-containing protein n=1 Tax=Serratia sp. N21D137 TaxID=3397495 RepID=UPI0039DF8B94